MQRTHKALSAINILLILAVIGIIWAPLYYLHNDWPRLDLIPNTEAVSDLPDDETVTLLRTVSTGALEIKTAPTPAEIVAAADGLLLGRLDGLGALGFDITSLGSAAVFRSPFDHTLVMSGDSLWQLRYSGFLLPFIFLQAYDETGRVAFLTAARDFIIGWRNYEDDVFVPEGFVWNDHAVASRAIVVSEFWYRYRPHRIFNEEDGRAIIDVVENAARLLAEKQLYTYGTNHGFIQNVALAKTAMSFPGAAGLDGYKELAFDRMEEQLDFLFSADGVVLEHSVGYHAFGLALLDDQIALLNADGRPVPPSVSATREKALNFLRQLARPDGTLPRIGDTRRNSALLRFPNELAERRGNVTADDDHGAVVYAKSAYAVHQLRNAGQRASGRSIEAHLATFWGNVRHMGHKHADELGLHLWAGGADWWTAVGYWPLSRSDQAAAVCWDGSNAPHRVGEACDKHRRTAVSLGSAQNETGFALDLVRTASDGFRARRQIVSLSGGTWLTLDSYDDTENRRARVVWLSDHRNTAVQSGATFRLEAPDSPDSLAVQFLTSGKTPVETVHGEADSTLGWVFDVEAGIQPAPGFVVELPSQNSWSLNVSVLEAGKQARLTSNAEMAHWRGPTAWKVALPLRDGPLTIERVGQEILVHDVATQQTASLTIDPIPVSEQVDRVALQSYSQAKAHYGAPFKPYVEYRVRVSLALIAFGVLFVAYIWGLNRLGDRVRLYGLIAPLPFWPILSAWLSTSYFV
jgi:hypothetical protein